MPTGDIILAVAFIVAFGAAAILLSWGRGPTHRYRNRASERD